MTEEALAGTPPGHGALHARTGGIFTDPARLGKWVVALLLGVAGASTAAFFMIFARVQFLENVAPGFYRSRSSLMETAQLLDTLVRIASLLYLGIWIAAAILFLKWVYRSNRNAREMGVAGLKFTPGWAVGCYFVPFANLGLPFLAMREIWNASLGRVEGTARPAYLVGWWWGLYLLDNTVASVSGFQAFGAKTIADFILSGQFTMVSHGLSVAGAILAAVLVRQVSANQIRVWRMSEVFA